MSASCEWHCLAPWVMPWFRDLSCSTMSVNMSSCRMTNLVWRCSSNCASAACHSRKQSCSLTTLGTRRPSIPAPKIAAVVYVNIARILLSANPYPGSYFTNCHLIFVKTKNVLNHACHPHKNISAALPNFFFTGSWMTCSTKYWTFLYFLPFFWFLVRKKNNNSIWSLTKKLVLRKKNRFFKTFTQNRKKVQRRSGFFYLENWFFEKKKFRAGAEDFENMTVFIFLQNRKRSKFSAPDLDSFISKIDSLRQKKIQSRRWGFWKYVVFFPSKTAYVQNHQRGSGFFPPQNCFRFFENNNPDEDFEHMHFSSIRRSPYALFCCRCVVYWFLKTLEFTDDFSVKHFFSETFPRKSRWPERRDKEFIRSSVFWLLPFRVRIRFS